MNAPIAVQQFAEDKIPYGYNYKGILNEL